jgi:hypothetical protein
LSDEYNWQISFSFPEFPIFQIRLRIKFEIYIKFIIGLYIIFNKEKDGFKFDASVLLYLLEGIKVSPSVEAGVYIGLQKGL